MASATRLYWHFKYYGFEQVALLDGGNAAWVDALEDLSAETSSVEKGNYQAGQENPELVATMNQVQQALVNKDIQLIKQGAVKQVEQYNRQPDIYNEKNYKITPVFGFSNNFKRLK